jgi:hypothetical protein
MNTSILQKNRFCYNYNPQGFINPVCKPIITASSEYLSSIICTTAMSGVSQGTLLQMRQQSCIQRATGSILANTIHSTIQNSDAISNQVYSQLLQAGAERNNAYRPYIYPVVPVSVMQLQMATANVGVPMMPITCLTGKGNQYITK